MAQKKSKNANRGKKVTGTKGIKKSEKVKTRLRVEQLNKESFMISELNSIDNKQNSRTSLNSLNVGELVKDHKEDKRTHKKLKDEKMAIDSDLANQVRAISGFSL